MRRASPLRAALGLLAGLLALPALPAGADDLGGAPYARRESPFAGIPDARLRHLLELDRIAPFEDKAPLWNHLDRSLQADLDRMLATLGLSRAVRRGELAVALVEISDLPHPRVATVNGDAMMYAASLPKIAVLLGAFEKIAEGRMELDGETRGQLERMIRSSSNRAATEMMRRVGKDYIARVLLSPRYRLYDPGHGGGLWAGKDYASAGLWMRDPLHNLSHGATAMQVARFYYLMATGNLVTPEHSQLMKEIMGEPALEHKFVKGLKSLRPLAALYRKSGSWSRWHCDSAIVERDDGASYIAVALSSSPRGGRWMSSLIQGLDRIVDRYAERRIPAVAAGN